MRQKRSVALSVMLTTLLLTAAFPLLAQPGPRGDNQGGCMMMQSYDTATELVVQGTVTGVETPDCPMQGKGVHLRVESEGKLYEVHLGPEWFVTEQQSFAVAPGDEVTVTGALGPTENGGEAEPLTLMAREVAAAGTTLTLRDENGVPVWAGSGRGPRNRS